MDRRFEKAVAVVTGAASGIGKAVATRLAAEGAKVVAVDRDAEKLNATIAGISEGEVVPRTCDVSDQSAVDTMIDEIADTFGSIDILVNNAGIASNRAPLHEITPEDWDRVISVNVRGVYLMQRAVIPHMLAQGKGSIINTASTGSFRAAPNSSAYLSSKGAVLMMTRAAAVDYAKDNIRINAVCPGTTNTDILAGSSEEQIKFLVSRSPQGRLCEPEEVAALVAFLASDEAPHITGGAYIIDGGRTAC